MCRQMMNTNNILLCHGTTTYIIIMFNSFREICVEIGEKRNTVHIQQIQADDIGSFISSEAVFN